MMYLYSGSSRFEGAGEGGLLEDDRAGDGALDEHGEISGVGGCFGGGFLGFLSGLDSPDFLCLVFDLVVGVFEVGNWGAWLFVGASMSTAWPAGNTASG
jgi:hypothetical protein